MDKTDRLAIIISELYRDEEFEEATNGSDAYNKLRAYFEDRLMERALSRDIIIVIPKIYRHLRKYGEVRHLVPRAEMCKVSGIPQMAAEVVIRFIS